MAQRRSPLTPQFTWDDASARYRAANGRFVSRTAVRSAIDSYLDTKAAQVKVLAEQLRDREISLPDWQRALEKEIAKIHLANAAAAKGGWAQMGPVDYGRVGGLVRPQYRYLEKFAVQIERGLPLDGRFLRRAMMYAAAGRATYHVVDVLEMAARGYDEERSILHARDHCSECVREAARGWVPLGAIVPIGSRICLTNCRCAVAYRKRDHRTALGEQGNQGDEESLTDYSDLLQEIEESVLQMKERGATLEEIVAIQQERIRNADRELCLLFDRSGNVVFTLQGERQTIDFSSSQMTQMKGNILVHNHPSARHFKNKKLRKDGASFSMLDMQMVYQGDLYEVRAVTPYQTFIMQVSRSLTFNEFRDLMNLAGITERREKVRFMKAGRSETDADWLARHEVWKRVAAKFGIIYRREVE